jgi:hypothetical protein
MLFEHLPSAPIDIEVTPDVCTVEVCGLSRRYASLQFSTSEESVLLLPANSFAEIGVERRFAVWGTSYTGSAGPVQQKSSDGSRSRRWGNSSK